MSAPDRAVHFHLYTLAPGTVRWRLLGGNNRDLGRGCAAYPTIGECRQGLERTVTELTALEPAIVRLDHRSWAWALRRGQLDMVACGHPFDRRPRCEEACLRFLRVAPTAVIGDVLTVVRWNGRAQRPSVQRPDAHSH